MMRHFFHFLIVLPSFAAAAGTITVTGVGEVWVAPELARFSVEVPADDMAGLVAALEAAGADAAANAGGVFVIRDLDRFDAVMEAVDAAGAVSAQVRFGVADPAPVRAEAEQRAVVQGMGKAAAAGLVLDGLEELDRVGSGWRGNDGRVVPEEIRFVATVNLVYRLRD